MSTMLYLVQCDRERAIKFKNTIFTPTSVHCVVVVEVAY